MITSDSINELATALSKAQGKISGALKDSNNPFFKSKYADLASCLDAAREHLAANGLAVIQTASANEGGLTVTTMLTHSSGQWVKDSLTMTPKDASPQSAGSCITYARRYSFAAIVGIAQIDEDGNQASLKDGSGKPDTKPVESDPRISVYAARFKTAMDADQTENEIAAAVCEIDTEINSIKEEHKNELYQAIANSLPSKYRNAIRTYIQQHRKTLKA